MNRPRVVASIEARMSSSRLPGKMMADINGTPAIGRVIQRLQKCRLIDDIILATTTDPLDDALEQEAVRNGVSCHRGSIDDVLKRVVEANEKMNTEILVEVTGDSILLDPKIIDWGIDTFLKNDVDLVDNTWNPGFPQGINIQVFWFSKLQEIDRKSNDPADREHVSLHFYEHQDNYKIIFLPPPPRWCMPDARFQLDYEEDLRFIREVYGLLEPSNPDFGLEDIVQLVQREPELLQINQHMEERSAR